MEVANVKKSRAEWFELVAQWRESGHTLKEYCESNGLKQTQFGYYVSLQRKQQKSNLGFAEVKTVSTGISLKLCGQHELVISSDFDECALLKLLNVANRVR